MAHVQDFDAVGVNPQELLSEVATNWEQSASIAVF